MSKFKLAVGLHNHQPVGNFDFVFEDAHRDAYAAFLSVFEKFKSIRISLHQSGILWRWQERNNPEYLETVRGLVRSGRIELMTGGFYEPILIAAPERDAIGQIEMLNAYLNNHFEVEPTGLWLTERIWEPHLPSMLARAGVKYLPVDDTHFIYAGFEREQLTGPFVTENNGDTVILLPIQKSLRYLIPFGKVEDVIDELKTQADKNPEGLAVYADDGEKFGVWPNTHEHCYGDGWLKDFFAALEDNSDWLEVVPLREAAEQKAVGRAYLPTASYEEMLHWSLPAKAFREYEAFQTWLKAKKKLKTYGRFVRGGHWRGFMAKYEEANLMHKKMISVSERFDRVVSRIAKPDKPLQSARDHLFAAQCNCPYWHGVFGGLYLPHIRQAIYMHLVEADKILNAYDEFDGTRIVSQDYDADGHPELVVRTESLTGVVKPDAGGMLLELSLHEPAFNLTDTLTRRIEGYHDKLKRAKTPEEAKETEDDSTASIHDLVLAKEPGLQDLLVSDWHLKRCFIDHFVSIETEFDGFRAGDIGDEGDFVLEPYEVRATDTDDEIALRRYGHLWRDEGALSVLIEKVYRFHPKTHFLDVTYRLSSPGGTCDVRFGVENNFNFQAGHADDRYVVIDGVRPEDSFLDGQGQHGKASRLAMIDEYRQIGVGLMANRPGTVWRTPIFTVSLSEGGFEKVYQGTSFVSLFELSLSAEPTEIRFRLHTGDLSHMPSELTAESSLEKSGVQT